MKKRIIVIATLMALLLCGCAAKGGGETPSGSPKDVIAVGNIEDAKYLLQMDINPSVLIGYAEDENVVYLASNNADGYEFLERHEANLFLGEPINAAVGALMLAAHEDGYDAEGFDVELVFVGEEKGDVESLMQIARSAAETCDFDIKVIVEGANEITYSPENGFLDRAACDACGGKGIHICEECSGKGERMVTVQREKRVRNDYVCEICGGLGWIDDGMHGGEIANCDSCGGMEGKMPSGDFQEKAYDTVMVDEEEMRFCEVCQGSGEVECEKCHGTGQSN